MPIHDRVVEAESQALFLRLVGERAHRIVSVRRGIDDVVWAGLAVEHRKPVVMLRCDDDVFHAGGLRDTNPLRRIEPDRVELGGELLVPRARDIRPRHDPFADLFRAMSFEFARGHRVETPVDEHAETGLAPPSHAAVSVGPRLGAALLWTMFVCGLANPCDGGPFDIDAGKA